jgi:glycosyltransferase involved in cell wall biosynthesis
MRICAIVKYPPIEGGVSAQTYWMCRALARRGHEVFVVTNADEVEAEYRAALFCDDAAHLEPRFSAGGSVTVRSSHEWDARQYAHIPAGNPVAAKLAAMATEIVREHDCDLILAFYLEPYGIAANLAAAWTGRPFAVRHSGSDRIRLMGHPDLGLAYKEVLRAATAVLSSGTDLTGFGVRADRVVSAPAAFIPAEFSPQAPPLDLNALLAQLTANRPADVLNPGPLTGLPVLGVYGKFGPQKGTGDLLEAVAALRDHGTKLQLVMLGGGNRWPAVEAAIGEHGLSDRTWRLPFIAPWRMPGFIRACDAVCFLEHGFEISEHRPRVAAEVLACGTPLIVSGEIAAKEAAALTDETNCYLVPDPGDHESLAAVIHRAVTDTAGRIRIGLAGAALLAGRDEAEIGVGYEKALAECLALARGRGSTADPAMRGRTALRGETAMPGGVPTTELADFFLARCPATARLLGDRLPGLLQEAGCAAVPASVPVAAYRLCALIASGLPAATAGLPDGQLCRIERNLLWFRVDEEGILGISAYPVPVSTARRLPADRAAAGTLRPVATRLARTERLSIDAAAYAQAIRAGSPRPASPAVPAHTALFHKSARLRGTVSRIGPRTEELLALCTGERPVDGILAALGVTGPREATVLLVIGQMLQNGLLALAATSVPQPCGEMAPPLAAEPVQAK